MAPRGMTVKQRKSFLVFGGGRGGGGQERERASILAGESEREEELLEKSLLINALALAKACPQTREVKGAMRNLARCT